MDINRTGPMEKLAVNLILAVGLVYGRPKDIPDSLKYLWENNIYARCSFGLSAYSPMVVDGFDGGVGWGWEVEPEAGIFLFRNLMRIGVAYSNSRGNYEGNTRLTSYGNPVVREVERTATNAVIGKVRVLAIRREAFRLPLGVDAGATWWNITAHDSIYYTFGGHSNFEHADSAKSFTLGISVEPEFHPVWWISIAADLGWRKPMLGNSITTYDGAGLNVGRFYFRLSLGIQA